MMKINIVYHVEFERAGEIKNWARERGFEIFETEVWKTGHVFHPGSDLIILMGGPMSVNDDLPWIGPEIEFLRYMIANGGKILGICLGAQLLAKAMDSIVYKNGVKEIGWYPVNFRAESLFPPKLTVFHWHGETFDVPEGAKAVGSSEHCLNQGFIYEDRIMALQFHLETNEKSLNSICDHCANELSGPGIVQSREVMLTGIKNHGMSNKQTLFKVLDSLIGE